MIWTISMMKQLKKPTDLESLTHLNPKLLDILIKKELKMDASLSENMHAFVKQIVTRMDTVKIREQHISTIIISKCLILAWRRIVEDSTKAYKIRESTIKKNFNSWNHLLRCYKGWITRRYMASTRDIPQPWPRILAVSTSLEKKLLCTLSKNPHMNSSMVISIKMDISPNLAKKANIWI